VAEILAAGGTGFIGQALVKHFLAEGFTITVLGRDAAKIKRCFGETVRALTWQEIKKAKPEDLLRYDCVINLCGANIGEKRWSDARKQQLIDSRIEPTTTLAGLLRPLGSRAPRLLTASAIGIYGLQREQDSGLPRALAENTSLEKSPEAFSAKLCQQWEACSHEVITHGVKVAFLRFAVVLDKNGGALAKLYWPYYFGFGGKIGSGRQPFSWITLNDLVRAVDFIIKHPEQNGVFNLASVQAVAQEEFAKALARHMHRPCIAHLPGWMVHQLFGQMGDELLLNGQHVVPMRLRQLGFTFDAPDIDAALNEIVN